MAVSSPYQFALADYGISLEPLNSMFTGVTLESDHENNVFLVSFITAEGDPGAMRCRVAAVSTELGVMLGLQWVDYKMLEPEHMDSDGMSDNQIEAWFRDVIVDSLCDGVLVAPGESQGRAVPFPDDTEVLIVTEHGESSRPVRAGDIHPAL